LTMLPPGSLQGCYLKKYWEEKVNITVAGLETENKKMYTHASSYQREAARKFKGEHMQVRNTKQREHIISVLRDEGRPMSINEIYNAIITDLPRIAKSTIYRNIDQLLEQNLIEKHHFNDNEIFYLYKKNESEHTHFIICDECKCTYSIPSCPIREIEDYIAAEGFVIKNHQIQITGLCKNCAQNHSK
jgi:Fur family ferric uptake transcriptional regulator